MNTFRLIIAAGSDRDGSAGLSPDSVEADILTYEDVEKAVLNKVRLHVSRDIAHSIVTKRYEGISWQRLLEELGDREAYDVGDLFRWLGE